MYVLRVYRDKEGAFKDFVIPDTNPLLTTTMTVNKDQDLGGFILPEFGNLTVSVATNSRFNSTDRRVELTIRNNYEQLYSQELKLENNTSKDFDIPISDLFVNATNGGVMFLELRDVLSSG